MHFSLCDLVTDITQNAAESGAALVELEIRETEGEFRFIVKDNGKGMDQEQLQRAVDPFVTDGIKHPHRKIGLGLPFLIQTAEQSGGGWDIQSKKQVGTTVTAFFDKTNVDMPPVGDVSGMFRSVILFSGPKEIVIHRQYTGGEQDNDYEVRKSELIDVLGDLEEAGSQIVLQKYLESMEENEKGEE
ncbi:ATPase [Spirochaetia bacterium]|nr:ATPase [Spirochaetia bacterium]